MIGHQPTGAIEGVVISAVAHEGLSVTVNGKRAMLAVITEDGTVVASGSDVAREVEAVAINLYRGFLIGKGHLRVLSPSIPLKPL